jgi:2-iminobutanoate/2-iminopropanoate deaminase
MNFIDRKKTCLIAFAALLTSISTVAVQAKEYITTPATQARAYSLAVTAENPKKTVYFAGQTGRFGPDGKLIEDFDGQARRAFALLNETLKKSGGSLADITSMTVFITDVRQGEHFAEIRKEFFPDGKFPGSALITVDGLMGQAQIEIQGIAVIDNK